MQIIMAGIDHSTASVEIRERFSFLEWEKTSFMQFLHSGPLVDGCILLCTCNRTELWACCDDSIQLNLPKLLCSFKHLDSEVYRSYFFVKSNQEAVHYLFELTSGLHSLIVGEDQILSQVKNALTFAREQECCGSGLEVLFRTAITAAKKVKTELSISTANASAVNYAISHLAKENIDFSQKKCLVIGNGEMGKRAASALLELGADVTVTIRQYRSGIVEVVPGCQRINYAERYMLIPSCDIIVSATSSPNTTLSAAALLECGIKPGAAFIDLAVPRDIDPAVRQISGIQLFDIDSFSVPKTEELQAQLKQAECLLAEQEQKFHNWLEGRDLLPKMDEIGDSFAEDVLFRIGASLKSLPKEQRELVQSEVHSAAAKEIKKLLFHLRDDVGADTFRRCVDAVIGRKHGNT